MDESKHFWTTITAWMTANASRNQLAKIVLSSTIIAALFAHLFCWTNTLFGHDSLLIVQTDWINQIAFGRPFQHIYLYFRGYIVSPWLIGVLGTLFLAISNLAICKILNIRSRGFIITLCCITATSPVLTLINATYIHDYDVYMLALLMSSLAVLLCKKYKNGWVAGIFFLCISMGLYPAYLQVTLVLIAGICLLDILRNKDGLRFTFCLKCILMVVLGAVLYVISVKCVQDLTGISPETGYNSAAVAFQFSDSPLSALIEAWIAPLSYLLFPETHLVRVSGACNLLLLLVFAFSVIRVCKRNRLGVLSISFAILLIVLMPLFANVISFASDNNIHSLTIYSYFLFYAVLFACLDISSPGHEKSSTQGSRARVDVVSGLVTTSLIILMALSNAIYANQVYLKKDLEYQSTLSIMTNLEERIESLPGYIPGKTPVAFSGNLAENPYFSDVRKGFPPSSDQASFSSEGKYTKYAIGLGADISIYDFTQMYRYYEYILGRPIAMATVEGLSESKKAPLESMSVYPVEGSIVFNEGVVLVKLS